MYLTANRSSATLAKRVNQVKMQIGEKYQNIKLEKDEEELKAAQALLSLGRERSRIMSWKLDFALCSWAVVDSRFDNSHHFCLSASPAAWLYRSSHNSIYKPCCFKYQALAYAMPSSHPCFIHSFLDL